MYYMPTELGTEDLILDAIVDLLTSKCQTAVDTGDVTRAVTIKAGPRQAAPESVSILIHENDPDSPSAYPDRPLRYRSPNPGFGGVLTGDPYADSARGRTTSGTELIGGGSIYSKAYTLEIEVFGRFMPAGLDIDREEVRAIASTVTRRAVRALIEAGPKIGTGSSVGDDFGGEVCLGPFMDTAWTDQEEGEALTVRRFIRFYYKLALDWSTDDW